MNSEHNIDDIKIGMSDLLTQTVTEDDLVLLSESDTDDNIAGECSDSGLLSASFINTILTAKLPGSSSIYLGNRMKFKMLAKVGETITTKVVVSNINRKGNIITLDTTCISNNKIIATGKQLTLVKKSI